MATLTATTGNSATAATYSPAQLPTSSDDVVVPTGVTLTINGDFNAKSLTITDGTVTQTSGSYSVTIVGKLTIAGSSGSGTGAYLITGSSTTQTLNVGTLYQTAATTKYSKFTVAAGATANITAQKFTQDGAGYLSGIFNNTSTVNYNGQLRPSDLAGTGNYNAFAELSKVATTITMYNKGPLPAIKTYTTSATAYAASGGKSLTINQYGGDLEFVSVNVTRPVGL